MSLSECSFLSIFTFLLAFSTHIPMHLASPASKVWYSCPPSVHLYPTFISLTVLPSIYLFRSSGGELWGSLSALLLWKPCNDMYRALNTFPPCSGCYMLALFCVCMHLRPRNAFPMELCNTPALSQKVPVHHTKKWQRKRDSWDTLW